jgi:hypothetical protein
MLFYANKPHGESGMPLSTTFPQVRWVSTGRLMIKKTADRKKLHGSPAQDGDTPATIY